MKKILAVILSLFILLPTFVAHAESKQQDTIVVSLCLNVDRQDSLKADGGYMHYAKEENAYYLYSEKKYYRIVKESNVTNQKGVEIKEPRDKQLACFQGRKKCNDWNDFHQRWNNLQKALLCIKRPGKVVAYIGGQRLYFMPIPKSDQSICIDTIVGGTHSNLLIECVSDPCVVKLKRYNGTRFKNAFFNGVALPDSIVTIYQHRCGQNGKQLYDELTASSAEIAIKLSNLASVAKEKNELKIVYEGFVEESFKEQEQSFNVTFSSTGGKFTHGLKENKSKGLSYIAIGVVLLVVAFILITIARRKRGRSECAPIEPQQCNGEYISPVEDAPTENPSLAPTDVPDEQAPIASSQSESCEEWFQKAIDAIEDSKKRLIIQQPKFSWFLGKVLSDQIKALRAGQQQSCATLDEIIQKMLEIKVEISRICQGEKDSRTQLESANEQSQNDIDEKIQTINRLQSIVDEYEHLKSQAAKLQALKDADKELSDITKLKEKVASLEEKITQQESEIAVLTEKKCAAERCLEEATKGYDIEIQQLKEQHERQLDALDTTYQNKLDEQEAEHREATSRLESWHAQALEEAENKRIADLAAEQEKSREKIGEWYKDKKFYDDNLDSHLNGIKESVDALSANVMNDQIALVYSETIERAVTTLDVFLDYVNENREAWETKGCSHVYKCMQNKLREQLSDKVSWINSILRLFSLSYIPSLNERMQTCGVSFDILDQAYRRTVVLLSNYGIEVEIAKPFIDDYDNNATSSYFEYNNVDSVIESYTGLPFLREQHEKAGDKRIITDMCRVAYFYQTDDSIELVKGEVTFFS